MADVFLSYSRRDSDFVRGLVADLEGRGKSVWVDTEGIADAEVFPDAIRSAIEGSDAFVFVITPESAASAYCENEVEHALALNKRVVPVLREAVPDDGLPEAIRVRNWIPYTADVDATAASERLVAALDTDLAYVHAHTRWLVKALEWDAKDRDRSFLLRGSELASAEAWLAGAVDDADPAPTALQREYLLAGRTASARRQRILVGVSLTGLAIALALAGFALLSRNQAVSAKANAQSRALAAESANQLSVDGERSVILAVEAERVQRTPEATYALRRAIDLSPVRGRLPTVKQSAPHIVYSPDGRQIAEAYSPIDDTMTVVLFDAKTLRVERRIHLGKQVGNHFVSSHVVAYNPSGTLLAAGTANGVLLLDPRTGKKLYVIKKMTNTHSINFSRDGKLLAAGQTDASGGLGHAMVWNLRTRTLRVIPTGSAVMSNGTGPYVARTGFSPDSRRLVVAGTGGIGVVDLATSRLLVKALPGADTFWAAEFSPDGALILVAVRPSESAPNPRLRLELRDARTLALRETIFSTVDGFKAVTSAHFSPDGTRIVYSAGHGFAVYSLAAHTIVYQTNLAAANYRSSAFSPDGRELTVAADDGSGAVFRADGAERAVIPVGGKINTAIGVHPLALTRDRVVATFSPRTGPNKGLEVVRSWLLNGKPTARPFLLTHHNNLPWFGIDPLGRTAITAMTEDYAAWNDPKVYSRLAPIEIWNLSQRRVVERPHLIRGFVWLPEFSGDGSHLVAAVTVSESRQQRLNLLDLTTGKLALNVKTPCATSGDPAVSFDGSFVAVITACPTLLTWRITSKGPVTSRLPVAVSTSMGPLVFSADGRQLAIANISGQGDVGIVDARSGKTLATLAGHTDRVVGVVFSPDGQRVVTASRDGTARVWDTHSGRLLRTLDHPDPLAPAGVAISPDGGTIATLDNDGVIRLWDTCTDCEDPAALMALAKTRVTRELTPIERATYLG